MTGAKVPTLITGLLLVVAPGLSLKKREILVVTSAHV